MKQYDSSEPDDQFEWQFGVIKPERGTVAASNFFYQYLGDEGEQRDIWWDLGHNFLTNYDRAEIQEVDVENSLVKLSFPCKLPWGIDENCKAIQTFDLSKGGIIVEEQLFEYKEKNAQRTVIRKLLTKASEAKQIDDVWIPAVFIHTHWYVKEPDKVNLLEGTVSDIELGKLTMADLDLKFPPGTEVRDDINGTRFHIGPDGSKVAALVKDASEAPSAVAPAAPPTTSSSLMPWIIGGNVVAILAVLLIYFLKRRQAAEM
jgi:hypothetical protein